jgi:hypothetical protein
VRSEVVSSAQIESDVVLGEDVIVDENATIRSSVVLPNTYVGAMVELSNAIVWGEDLIRVDTGVAVKVADGFLLGDLESAGLGPAAGGIVSRTSGWLLLLASLPRWPLAFLASLGAGPGRPLRRTRRLGNRLRVDDRGERVPVAFVVSEWATRIPALRYLPRLWAVACGDLRVVGVLPLDPDRTDSRTEDWELLRDQAPVGLLGPAQLAVAPGAPEEELAMADAVYARTRSRRADLGWLLRGALALLTPRAWRPLPKRESSGGPPAPESRAPRPRATGESQDQRETELEKVGS